MISALQRSANANSGRTPDCEEVISSCQVITSLTMRSGMRMDTIHSQLDVGFRRSAMERKMDSAFALRRPSRHRELQPHSRRCSHPPSHCWCPNQTHAAPDAARTPLRVGLSGFVRPVLRMMLVGQNLFLGLASEPP